MNYKLLENYIKAVLDQSQIKTLHVFDFDMTLYDHDKEDWIKKVVLELKNSLQDRSTRVILCTARSNKDEYIKKTESLLKQNNMSLEDFDYCYFKSTNRKESTPNYKSNVILDEVCANNSIETVKFWDDREDTLQKVESDLKAYNKNIDYIPVKC
jgi:hypothetical protein